jgi:hypothetical protein
MIDEQRDGRGGYAPTAPAAWSAQRTLSPDKMAQPLRQHGV